MYVVEEQQFDPESTEFETIISNSVDPGTNYCSSTLTVEEQQYIPEYTYCIPHRHFIGLVQSTV